MESSYSLYKYNSYRPDFYWADGCTMEARMRAPVAQVSYGGLRAPNFGGPDGMGRIVFAWIWSDGVALSTDQNADAGPGLAAIAFDAATDFHTYRVVTDANGAALRIDGVERLRLPYTTMHTDRSRVGFGNDSRFTSSGFAMTEWQYFRFQTFMPPEDVVTCPYGMAEFSIDPAGTEPFVFQWQWREAGASNLWVNVAEGPNTDSTGIVRFLAIGSMMDTLRIARDNHVQGSIDVVAAVRCVVSSSCGDLTSELATLTVCYADVDCSGFVDLDDYMTFVASFEAGTGDGDFDGSGFVDTDDFDAFVRAFENGC